MAAHLKRWVTGVKKKWAYFFMSKSTRHGQNNLLKTTVVLPIRNKGI